jgi:hypothetical protein
MRACLILDGGEYDFAACTGCCEAPPVLSCNAVPPPYPLPVRCGEQAEIVCEGQRIWWRATPYDGGCAYERRILLLSGLNLRALWNSAEEARRLDARRPNPRELIGLFVNADCAVEWWAREPRNRATRGEIAVLAAEALAAIRAYCECLGHEPASAETGAR